MRWIKVLLDGVFSKRYIYTAEPDTLSTMECLHVRSQPRFGKDIKTLQPLPCVNLLLYSGKSL